jgi:voltage-gated potassium channel
MNGKTRFALEKRLIVPMLFLSFVWFCVLILELVYGMNDVLSILGSGIWFLFILYFAMRLATAEDKRVFLRKHWLFVIAILFSVLRFFPYLQSFTVVRALTATFGMQVIWLFLSAIEGLHSLRRALGHRGAGYALALTLVVMFAGAAGMLHFEGNSSSPQSIHTYSRALWWTAMQMTNIGTAYSIQTTGGRLVSLCVSIYAAAMFGYLTALFATLFIDRDRSLNASDSIQDMKSEIAQLRLIIESMVSSAAEGKSVEKERS